MATHALDRHVALIGFMGAGKTTLGEALAARLGRPFVDVDGEIERESSPSRGSSRPAVRQLSGSASRSTRSRRCASATPAVIALGGGAVGTDQIRSALRERALTILVEIDA